MARLVRLFVAGIWSAVVTGTGGERKSAKAVLYVNVKSGWSREPWMDGGGGAKPALAAAKAAGTASGDRSASAGTGNDGGRRDHSRAGRGVHDGERLPHTRRRGRGRVRMRCSLGLPLAAVQHADNAALHPSPTCTIAMRTRTRRKRT